MLLVIITDKRPVTYLSVSSNRELSIVDNIYDASAFMSDDYPFVDHLLIMARDKFPDVRLSTMQVDSRIFEPAIPLVHWDVIEEI